MVPLDGEFFQGRDVGDKGGNGEFKESRIASKALATLLSGKKKELAACRAPPQWSAITSPSILSTGDPDDPPEVLDDAVM